MANDRLMMPRDWLQFQTLAMLQALAHRAEKIRLIGAALERGAADVFADAPAEELRQIAVVVKNHAISLLIEAASMAGEAERLETIVDILEGSECSDELAREHQDA